MRRARRIAGCPHDPLIRDVVALGERDECHGGEPTVGVTAEADDLVDCDLRVSERLCAFDERR